jgi:UDP-N-acetylmuramyl pentapeptide phosphotransferase/UDP-N-acetylglucosamine-1-phosphate transferase
MPKKRLSWKEFCALVLATEDIGELESMMRTLKKQSPPSLNRMLRVHSRFNKLRAEEERQVLVAIAMGAALIAMPAAASDANGEVA